MLKCLRRRNVRDVPLLLMNIHEKHGVVNCWHFMSSLNFLSLWRGRTRVPCLSGKLLLIRLVWLVVWWSIQEPGLPSIRRTTLNRKIAWQSYRGNSRSIHHTHDWRRKAPSKPFRNSSLTMRIWPVRQSMTTLMLCGRLMDDYRWHLISLSVRQVRSGADTDVTYFPGNNHKSIGSQFFTPADLPTDARGPFVALIKRNEQKFLPRTTAVCMIRSRSRFRSLN